MSERIFNYHFFMKEWVKDPSSVCAFLNANPRTSESDNPEDIFDWARGYIRRYECLYESAVRSGVKKMYFFMMKPGTMVFIEKDGFIYEGVVSRKRIGKKVIRFTKFNIEPKMSDVFWIKGGE